MKTTEVPPHGCPVCLQPFDQLGTGDACVYCSTLKGLAAGLRTTTLAPASTLTVDEWRAFERFQHAINTGKRAP